MLKLLHPNSCFYLKPKTRNAKPFSLSPRAQERFTHVSIRIPIKQFRPILQAPRLSELLRSRLSLPADLFHRVIELDTDRLEGKAATEGVQKAAEPEGLA